MYSWDIFLGEGGGGNLHAEYVLCLHCARHFLITTHPKIGEPGFHATKIKGSMLKKMKRSMQQYKKIMQNKIKAHAKKNLFKMVIKHYDVMQKNY